MKTYKVFASFLLCSLLLFVSSCRKKVKQSVTSFRKRTEWSVIDSRKKRVLICSCTGGGAHTAASSAIKKYLGDEYTIEVVNIFSEIINPRLDPFYSEKYNTEKLYDYFLQNQSILCAEAFTSFGKLSFRYISSNIEALIEELVRDVQPDIVLSVIPLVNGAIYRVTQKLDIPFAIIPVDLDVTNYCNGLYNAGFKKFFFGLNFDDEGIRKTMHHTGIPRESLRYLGFPVRPEFLASQHNLQSLKNEFNIPSDKKVAMVLMGSAGSKATLRYAKAFCRFPMPPVHLILCLGKNEGLRKSIEKLKFPDQVSVSIVGFTDRIADLMRISDVLITKPGPASVCEALCVKIPMILDRTRRVLWWEKMNVDFVERYGFGQALHKMRSLPKVLASYLYNDSSIQSVQERMNKFEFPDSMHLVRELVEEMIALSEYACRLK